MSEEQKQDHPEVTEATMPETSAPAAEPSAPASSALEPSAPEQSAAEPALTPPPPPAHTPVLQKLSAPPFPRTGFPLLGILASVYEHVTSVAERGHGCGSLKQASSADGGKAA